MAIWLRHPSYNDDTETLDRGCIRCRCGTPLELWDSWANECDKCGQEYNGSGQALADRSQWGEETGETF